MSRSQELVASSMIFQGECLRDGVLEMVLIEFVQLLLRGDVEVLLFDLLRYEPGQLG